MSRTARALDAAMDRTVVPGFSRIGFAARSRLMGWADEPSPDLTGRVAAVTGATSGLGAATARALGGMGAEVMVLGRDEVRGRKVVAEILGSGGRASWHAVDLSQPDRARTFGAQLADLPALDILVHNAGVLVDQVIWTPDGVELTAALHVVRPFELTTMALPALRRADSARVITVSSGGMYTQALRLDWLEAAPHPFDGVRAYANAKRAQVAMNGWWAAQVPEVAFHAMHPGWADTPGVTTSLPRFARMAAPLLRTPEQGADTIVWLAGTARPVPSGRFWCDRAQRTDAMRPGTRTTDLQVADLVNWLQRKTGDRP